MNVLTCITVLLVLSGGNSSSENSVVPQEFRGVWKIVAATDNGADRRLAEDPDGGLSVGECGMLEIIICDTRIVIVETDGDAMVGRTKILHTKPHTKIEWTGFGYHAKQDGPSYVVLRQIDENSDRLTKTQYILRFARKMPKMWTRHSVVGNSFLLRHDDAA